MRLARETVVAAGVWFPPSRQVAGEGEGQGEGQGGDGDPDLVVGEAAQRQVGQPGSKTGVDVRVDRKDSRVVMDMNVPIAPGAALAEPELRRSLQARFDELGGDSRRSVLAAISPRDRVERLWHFLAYFPWREYDYKFGRWQRVARWWWDTHEFFAKKWVQTFDGFQLLDPQTGQQFGEMAPPQPELLQQSGKLWFAGDPMIGGVFSPAGDGRRELHFVWVRTIQLGAARKLNTLVSFSSAPRGLSEASRGLPVGGAPWLVDHPTKPTK